MVQIRAIIDVSKEQKDKDDRAQDVTKTKGEHGVPRILNVAQVRCQFRP